MVREYVKWDYELRNPEQLEEVVDRAMAIAMTEPRGPIYLTLPREVLGTKWPDIPLHRSPRLDLSTFRPDPAKIEKTADLLVRSRLPLIVTSALGRCHDSVQALVSFAEKEGIGVVSFNPEYMNFPRDHFCHLGFNSEPYVKRADTILAIDCDVPWFPNLVSPSDSTTVIQAGIDPLYSTYPIRTFPSDINIHGESEPILAEIAGAMQAYPERDDALIRDRNETLRCEHEKLVEQWEAISLKGAHDKPLDFRWVSHVVGETLRDRAIVVNEYDNGMKENMGLEPGSYFGVSHAGYLGWGLGTALGVALAKPDAVAVATVGDGSYIFGVPSAFHLASASLNVPILVIVYNNQSYGAVKRATLDVHAAGWAAQTNTFPLSRLEPTPDYEKICDAFGGYGEKVTEPDQVRPALDRAIHAVVKEKRQAVLNMVCAVP
jgi:acetolactate synthase I/II/III large subunit